MDRDLQDAYSDLAARALLIYNGVAWGIGRGDMASHRWPIIEALVGEWTEEVG